jgi:hypothetical protein
MFDLKGLIMCLRAVMEREVGFNIEDTWLYMGLLAKRVAFTGSYYMMIEAGSRNSSVKVAKGLGGKQKRNKAGPSGSLCVYEESA